MGILWSRRKTVKTSSDIFGEKSGKDCCRNLWKDVPVWISLFDANGNFITINKAGLDVIGIAESEIIGKSLQKLWTPEFVSQVEPAIVSVLNCAPISFTSDFKQKNGRLLSLSIILNPVYSQNNILKGFTGIFIDVTHYMRSTEALQRTLSSRLDTSALIIASSEHRYQSVVDGSPNWISLLNFEGRILTINPAGLDNIDKIESEVSGRFLWEFFPSTEHANVKDAIKKTLKGEKFTFESYLNHPRRHRITFNAVLNPIQDYEGISRQPVKRFVGIFTDISERKKAEESLRQAHDQLEIRVKERTEQLARANEALQAEIIVRKTTEIELRQAKEEAESANHSKSDFLANMSHEIRTPMNSILGFTSLLLKSEMSIKQRDFAETVQISGKRLLALLDDILDLSKIEAGKLLLNNTPFDIAEIVKESINLFIPRAQEKGINLILNLGELPPKLVLGDADRVRQILVNLIGNAVKFTEKGEVRVEALFEPTVDGRINFKIRVSDTGVGILSGDIERLFQKFTQIDSSRTRKFGGTGLGLAISKHLVEQMNGNIGVSSRPGEGSIFYFFIPFNLTESSITADFKAGHAEESHARRAAIKMLNTRILVVEDDPEGRKLCHKYLEELGCNVSFAINGTEALDWVDREKFDLILMDLQLPEIDGIAVTRKIRKREKPEIRTPIIAVTAMAMKGDRERCIESGMDDYISKPFDPETLQTKIESFILNKK